MLQTDRTVLTTSGLVLNLAQTASPAGAGTEIPAYKRQLAHRFEFLRTREKIGHA